MDVERDLWRVNALSTGCKTRLASPVTLYVLVGGWSKGSFTCGQARLNLHPLICLGRCLFIFQHCNRFLRSLDTKVAGPHQASSPHLLGLVALHHCASSY